MQASDGPLYGTAANVVYSISLDEPPTLSTVTSLQGLGSYPGGLIQVSNRFFRRHAIPRCLPDDNRRPGDVVAPVHRHATATDPTQTMTWFSQVMGPSTARHRVAATGRIPSWASTRQATAQFSRSHQTARFPLFTCSQEGPTGPIPSAGLAIGPTQTVCTERPMTRSITELSFD